eukprot:CAMPEP_0170167618 /NCGR_PEP_ID=MMETSP0040_2-20121228/976_1 /TAXON_ID=641309 /ORGANISM="Lotharella oceanica, Strain CCMP622" /LENGTH=254 /DNA_ID=CAMNT_0010405707 /DNA_START=30 /DNA_END=794 /DNA_ORIENTATION=-
MPGREAAVHPLPSYSSERFFLLSELKVDGVQVKSLDGSVYQERRSDEVEEEPTFAVVYMIWRQSSGIAKAVGDLDALVKGCLPRTPNSIALFVESHNEPLPENSEDDKASGETPKPVNAEESEAVSVAKALIERIDERYPKLHSRVVGVSDHTAACPVLEECVNFSKTITGTHALQFVIRGEVDMIGLDGKGREPDAVEGVNQWLVGDKTPAKAGGTNDCGDVNDDDEPAAWGMFEWAMMILMVAILMRFAAFA